jgi:hypothetical protein
MATNSEVDSAQSTRLQAGLRLLQSLASRGSSEIAALLIPALLLWVSTRNSPAVSAGLAWWWGLMIVMALGFCCFAAACIASGGRRAIGSHRDCRRH